MLKEACVENLVEALRTQELGADRIELCDNLAVGGTTPSGGTILTCMKYLRIPIVVMIRPRGGNFVYTPAEIECMIEDIRFCRNAGVYGIATGVLTPDGHIDMNLLKLLIHEAGQLEVTFHKAIDESPDPVSEILSLKDTGVRRVLTSGGKPTAAEGTKILNAMIKAVPELQVVAAGRVTRDNLAELSGLIQTNEFHGRKIVGDL